MRGVKRETPSGVSGPVLEPLAIPPSEPLSVHRRSPVLEGYARTLEIPPEEIDAVVAEAYDELAARLRAFAIRATRDGDLADDLVQEAFLRLVAELQRGRRPENIAAWLHRVVANLVVSGGRRRSVAQRFLGRLVRRDHPPTPEDAALGDERERLLALALARLSADARVAVLLAARGMGAAEIGLVIRRTPAATRTYLCRARMKLREALSELGMDGPR